MTALNIQAAQNDIIRQVLNTQGLCHYFDPGKKPLCK